MAAVVEAEADGAAGAVFCGGFGFVHDGEDFFAEFVTGAEEDDFDVFAFEFFDFFAEEFDEEIHEVANFLW